MRRLSTLYLCPTRHWQRTAIICTSVLALVIGIAACRPDRLSAKRTFRVGLDLWAGYYPLILADELGYLGEENVAVSITIPKDSHRMIGDFAARRYDAIGASLGDVVLLARDHPAVRMILCSDESAGGDVIFGREAPHNGVVLRGKRVGTSIGGFGELFVRRFLQKYGVQSDEITLVSSDAATVPTLLHRGELDFGHTWEPYASQARVAGCHDWFTSFETPGLILDGLMVHSSIIEEDPDALRGLVRAWFRAVDWWREHPAEGNARLEKRLDLEPGSVSLRGVRLLDHADNRRLFTDSPTEISLHRTIQEYIDHFVSRGMINRRLAPEELLESSFIE